MRKTLSIAWKTVVDVDWNFQKDHVRTDLLKIHEGREHSHWCDENLNRIRDVIEPLNDRLAFTQAMNRTNIYHIKLQVYQKFCHIFERARLSLFDVKERVKRNTSRVSWFEFFVILTWEKSAWCQFSKSRLSDEIFDFMILRSWERGTVRT